MKKSLGQNFLRNKDITKKIVQLADFCKSIDILEIGPGDGALTDELLNFSGKITLLEYDKDLIKPLKNKYSGSNVKIIQGDARNFIIDVDNKINIIGNLPYYASNIIIRNFMFQNKVNSMVFTVQKEVGEMIVANDGKKSFLSVLMQTYCDVKELMIIKNVEFYPIPKVDSMTIKLIPKSINKDDDYINFIRGSFSNPRKKISNSISMGLNISNDQTNLILDSNKIDQNLRPQHLSLNQWENLYKSYKKLNV